MKIVCLGDSLTGPSPGASYLDKYIKWSDLLQFGLEVLGEDAVVLNQGHAGTTTSVVRQDLEARLLRHHPDVVVILLGANNYAPNVRTEATPSRFREDLRDIVHRAGTAGIRVLLLQYPDPRAEDPGKVWAHGNQGNPVIAEVAEAEGVPVLDVKPSFDKAAEFRSLAELASPVDGVHLNPGGELVLARAVLDKLLSLGWIRPRAGLT